eukprot:scaffold41939_cov23-Tisochrysis_lutea.AAC.5
MALVGACLCLCPLNLLLLIRRASTADRNITKTEILIGTHAPRRGVRRDARISASARGHHLAGPMRPAELLQLPISGPVELERHV